jgi:DNA-binding CsgD family transcriptional regulator
MNLWEDELWFQLSTRLLAAARELGVLMALPTALSNFISVSLLIGDLPLAGALLAEVDAITEVTGSTGQFHGTMALAAWQGLEQELTSAAAVAATHSDTTPQGVRVTVDAYTHALLYNGLGRYSDGLLAAQRASARPDDLSYALWALPELVEAASRCGEHKLAMDGLAMLQATTIPAGTNWGLGVEARCRALTGNGTLAESAYEESLELLGRTRFATQIARSHLVYGEWLRRENRRVDARDHLRKAQSMFSTIGATGFALRAERELAATGERARSRRATSSFELTPQELQIAHLAADGLSNSEIGTQLFISPRTVEYHLHKVFAKLGIDSRNQLNRVLSEGSLA